jgi:hypothetical protein
MKWLTDADASFRTIAHKLKGSAKFASDETVTAYPKDLSVSDNTVGTAREPVAKFEEGKPADPTKNMSPEDAAEWKKQKEENKDNFKAASARWKK